MDVREKLVELLSEKCMETCKQRKGYVCSVEECKRSKEKCCGFYADHLIAHGVTVQEWISVKDGLPEPFVPVLVQMPGEEPFPTVREGFISNDGIWQSAMFRREPGEVTHWKPMPHPPKEVE